MPDEQQQPNGAADDFSARTAAAEGLPLPDRADAFAALHDELRTRLESGQATVTATAHGSGRAAGAGQVWSSNRTDGSAGG